MLFRLFKLSDGFAQQSELAAGQTRAPLPAKIVWFQAQFIHKELDFHPAGGNGSLNPASLSSPTKAY